jgi:hypothetical protein
MTDSTPPPNRRKGQHIKSLDRVVLRQTLAQDYRAGSSVRGVAALHHIGYGTAYDLLKEEGVTLRSRAGKRGGAR